MIVNNNTQKKGDKLNWGAINQSIVELYRLVSEVPVNEFKQQAFSILQQHVSFDSGLWSEGIAEGLHINTLFLHNQPMEMMEHYQQYVDGDELAKTVSENPGITFDLDDLVDKEEFKTRSVYFDFCKPYGVEWAISTSIYNEKLALFHYICLYRNKTSVPYTANDKQTKNAFMPHLINAFKQSQYLSLVNSSDWRSSETGSAAVDQHGNIHQATDTFLAHIENIDPDWTGPLLPKFMLDNYLEEKKFFQSGYEARVSEQQDLLYLVEIRPAAPYTQLTIAEQKVAACLKEGASYKAVAKTLGISPSTVTNHVNKIYAKLSVKSKTELVRLLYTG
ncbi:MAG: helix-turn-helix transcriptional regulator [Methylococcaceae bacterium]|nr:helix-turn-helix transcriptional regulator [Methylococcaceae bacterium]